MEINEDESHIKIENGETMVDDKNEYENAGDMVHSIIYIYIYLWLIYIVITDFLNKVNRVFLVSNKFLIVIMH